MLISDFEKSSDFRCNPDFSSREKKKLSQMRRTRLLLLEKKMKIALSLFEWRELRCFC